MLGLILAGLLILVLWRTRLHPLLALLFALATWLIISGLWALLIILLSMAAILGLAALLGLHLRSMSRHYPPAPTTHAPLTQADIDGGRLRDE